MLSDDDSFISEEDLPGEWLAQTFDLATLNSLHPQSTHNHSDRSHSDQRTPRLVPCH